MYFVLPEQWKGYTVLTCFILLLDVCTFYQQSIEVSGFHDMLTLSYH